MFAICRIDCTKIDALAEMEIHNLPQLRSLPLSTLNHIAHSFTWMLDGVKYISIA